MSVLGDLKAATSLSDLAKLIGYKPSALSFLIHHAPATSKYTSFSVPKKSGGVRLINAPSPKLKTLQQHLVTLLTKCRKEIDEASNLKPLSHGFRKGQSIITNANPHIRRRYVLNLDLEDFFPSINFGRVRGYFIKNNDFKLHKDVATVIAQIACHANSLPQGAPTSPIISDLVAHLLDVRLVRLAKKNNCTYTRYADDLTFSTNVKVFPTSLALQTSPSDWELGKPLSDVITDVGFKVNPLKTRMQLRGSRQTVTGLTVNQKVNIQAGYYRRVRSMCYELFKTGLYFQQGSAPVSALPVVEGQLNHCFRVKHEVAYSRKVDIQNDKRDRGVRKLYRRFLFYKHFVQLTKPLLICEGKTDVIYLKLALRSLAASFPSLVTTTAAGEVRNVGFFNHTDIADNLLKLGGGSGGMQLLIKDYASVLKYFRSKPLAHPVILVIDNDDGADDIFAAIYNVTKTKVSRTSTADFYHIVNNLFLVKTPESGIHGTSRIEDLFKPSVLKTVVDGKIFNPAKKIDPTKEYGKIVFAEKVVRPNANKIDFSAFNKFLGRIEAILKHYKPP
ncbi:retron Ec67 family RNA-directed DNA polymerase/endonuclease [Bradyrhizobium sp. Leo121]|uniref:retron Ec67 family RNA-directed DNA polymerase/endonuclease n=1 Tax=Bradyrhizobium sp. Leo121 TaxID=1571195 RepID=UPI001A939E64|nr:retron Ec67 family RNA-directed DNA polymerase/endonuclease [Bradyrhizobium sp. Leo121]